MSQLSSGKTCGNDGLPIDFYKLHWRRLKRWLFEAITEAYELRRLHRTALMGVINLIPKSTKDTRYLKFLHLITILNSDC